jgi:hypothetical protein
VAASTTTSLRLRTPLEASSFSSEDSEASSSESPSPTPPNGSKARAALRHVLEDVCRFAEGSAVRTAFRRGGISTVSDLCDLAVEQVPDWVLAEGRGDASASSASSATPTADQMIEINKILTLKRWREHLRRQRGGIAPRDDDWLELTSDDFEEFRALPLSDQDNVEAFATFEPDPPAFEAAARAAQAFVESITAQQPVPIPGSDGMFVMKDVVKLERKTKRSDLVIRTCTRPFWQACIDAAETPDVQCRVCAVGTPGIGKTASTLYLIRMLLLERKKTVVYHVRSVAGNRFVYEFVPGPAGGVVANVYPEQGWEFAIPSLYDPSTYYVVDPGIYEASCNPDVEFLPNVIIVTSPDSKHWGGSEFFKDRDDVTGVLKVYPLWELDELLQARPYLGRNVSVAEVKERYFQVGGVPRHVFASAPSFEAAVKGQSLAVNALSADQVDKLADLQTISVTTFDTSQPKSALIGLRVADDDDGTFSRYAVDVIATRVVGAIFQQFMKKMWLKLLLPSVDNSWIFESYTRYLMVAEPRPTFEYRKGVGKVWRSMLGRKTIQLGGCKEIRYSSDIVAAAKKRPMVVFHPVDLSQRLIDFIYQDGTGHFHAFQATLAVSHSAKGEDIAKLEEQVGGYEKLSLHYVVPEFRYVKFVTDPVDPQNPPGKDAVPAKCSIYHVRIPNPSTNGTATATPTP